MSSKQIAENEPAPDLERILGCLSRSDRTVIEKLGAEIERLRAALDRYGRHEHPNCYDLTLKEDSSFGPRNGCLCGFDAAKGEGSPDETTRDDTAYQRGFAEGSGDEGYYQRTIHQLKEAIYWALGERGVFGPEPKPLAGKYRRAFWWRTELRKRSGLPINGQSSSVEPARRIPPREFDIESHTGLYTEPSRELPPAFQSLLDLQPNWDSYGSKRINLACVQKAYEIWKQLAGTWLPVPHSDGTVGLEQHQGGFDIEIDVDLALPAEKAPEPQMSMLPNDHHPGPRCSCRECLSRYPSQKVSAKLCDHRRGIDDSGHCVMCDELIMPPLNGSEEHA